MGIRPRVLLFAVLVLGLIARVSAAQGLTGAMVGAVTDQQGALLAGATVQLSSPDLIGGPWSQVTSAKGQLFFPVLPPGRYRLEVSFTGFKPYHEEGIDVGAGSTIERRIALALAGLSESVVVEVAQPRLDARNPGFATNWTLEDIQSIPTRRFSMFDFIRASPGISPTSPGASPAGGASSTSVSAFGSGTNENQFLIDDTNTTCPCNGVSRSEPGIDFIQEIHVQSVGASAEYGSVQGAVINVITRQGSDRFLYDASYFAQTAGLTSQPVKRPYGAGEHESGYERDKYYDFTTNLGGPAVRDRLWFFGGYQRVRDYDSQPGTDPAFPRTYQQDKAMAKLTWKFGQSWRLVQSLQFEHWVSPEQPTSVKPFETTQRRHASVPTVSFGNLTHIVSDRTIWEVRVGRFVHTRIDDPSSGDRKTPNHQDTVTKVWSGGPAQLGRLTLNRTSVKTILTHYRSGLWGADHQWKVGGQFERGEGEGYYGRFSQGVLTGEFSSVHPGASPTTTTDFNPATGDYTGNSRVDDPAYLCDQVREIGLDDERVRPEPLLQIVFGQGVRAIEDQRRQQVERLWREVDLTPVPRQLPRVDIEHERSEAERHGEADDR
jgi:carboxypeptidase family protein